MNVQKRMVRILANVVLVLGMVACGGGYEATAVPSDHRLIRAELSPEDASALSRQALALQLAAVAVDARLENPLLDIAVSRPKSPGASGDGRIEFDLALPMDRSYILLLQVPLDGRNGLGKFVARLRFPSGQDEPWSDVISGQTIGISIPLSDLDLGKLDLAAALKQNETDVVIELGSENSINPLDQNDSDGDGHPDYLDADDDNDFVPDAVDDDANGDDIPDAVQNYNALLKWDSNGDGVPDFFQP